MLMSCFITHYFLLSAGLPSVEFHLEVSTIINPGYLQLNRPIVFSTSMMWHLQSTAPSRFWQRGSQVFISSHILCFLTQMCLTLSSPLAGVLLPGMAFISATKDVKMVCRNILQTVASLSPAAPTSTTVAPKPATEPLPEPTSPSSPKTCINFYPNICPTAVFNLGFTIQ